MKYEDFQIHFISNKIIKDKADFFRKKYWGGIIPVDIEKIIAFKMGIDIIPIPELKNWCDTDALITSDWSAVYVDNDNYMDDRYYSRLRFSLAHEIGHYILHKKSYESLEIESFENFYSFIENVQASEYSYLETQANKFANYLLIPREILKIEKQKLLNKHKGISEIEEKQLNAYMANPLSKIFKVSQEALEIALNND